MHWYHGDMFGVRHYLSVINFENAGISVLGLILGYELVKRVFIELHVKAPSDEDVILILIL